MSSVNDARDETSVDSDDRTARARIRDAAIERFADRGVDGTSVRAVADAAGVSAALVIHHFGSKDRLRVACDRHVAALVRERKTAAAQQGANLDVAAALRSAQDGPPLLRYLARMLHEGSAEVAALVDELVDDAERYLGIGEEAGTLQRSSDRRGRAAVLTIWSLGALLLHEHLTRLLGADIAGAPADQLPYALPALEILGQGIFTPDAAQRMLEGLRQAQEEQP